MSDNIKYGIIGAGTMGREHIRNIDIIAVSYTHLRAHET